MLLPQQLPSDADYVYPCLLSTIVDGQSVNCWTLSHVSTPFCPSIAVHHPLQSKESASVGAFMAPPTQSMFLKNSSLVILKLVTDLINQPRLYLTFARVLFQRQHFRSHQVRRQCSCCPNLPTTPRPNPWLWSRRTSSIYGEVSFLGFGWTQTTHVEIYVTWQRFSNMPSDWSAALPPTNQTPSLKMLVNQRGHLCYIYDGVGFLGSGSLK